MTDCNPSLRTEDLLASIDRLNGARVTVLGDIMLDVYLEGDACRISPEAPVPVVNFVRERNLLGGAGNVARNIWALGGVPTLIGLCGNERAADLVEDDALRCGFGAKIHRSRNRSTTVKTRVMAQGQQLLRLDKETYREPDEDELSWLAKTLEASLNDASVVIFSDYAKGTFSQNFWNAFHEMLGRMPARPKVIVDPKPKNTAFYSEADILTPNRRELAFMSHRPVDTTEELLAAGSALMESTHCRELVVTLAGQGMALFMADGSVWNIPTVARTVFDVTGAGDTVIAVMAQCLACGMPLQHAAVLANYAAGEVVRHVGVASVDADALKLAVREYPVPNMVRWR